MARTRTGRAGEAVAAGVIYTRVSTVEQEREGMSLPAQLADCRKYCVDHSWAILGEYQDVMSGRRNDRPQYQAMLAEVRRLRAEGQSVALVVKWLHRLGRRVSERVRVWEELDEVRVPIYSVTDGHQSKVVHDVMASIAEEESRQIGDRVADTWRHTTSRGWAKTTTAPWGYSWRPATDAERAAGSPRSVLDRDPIAAPFATEAFERVARGDTMHSVGRWAAALDDKQRGRRLLDRRTLLNTLASPVYVSRQPLPKDRNERTLSAADIQAQPVTQWPSLCSEALWRAVQDRLVAQRDVPRQASGRYLLSGWLRCPRCGSGMRGDRNARVTRYRCRDDRALNCGHTGDVARLDGLVLAEVDAVLDGLQDPRKRAALRRAWEALRRPAQDTGDDAKTIRRLQERIERANKRISRAGDMLLDGVMDGDAYRAKIAESRADIADASNELESLRGSARPVAAPKLPDLDVVVRLAGGWAGVLEGADIAAKRDVLATLLERVVPVRERRGVYRVDMTWTPLGRLLRTPVGSSQAEAA